MTHAIQRPVVLLVDDDYGTLELLRRLLAAVTPHVEIVTVTDGAAALAVTSARPVDLVLADYYMPLMNGIQLADAIKIASPRTRVVIISVADRNDVVRRAIDVGADDVLTKPFVLADLKRLITQFLPIAESDGA